MSDFQLIAGLATLVSGFAQLHCGLSTYHWQKVVRLAWFSSITHLCCLTFLRDHFYARRAAQLWRIPGMALLVIMLVVALLPTAAYWDDDTTPYDQALCFFIPAVNAPSIQFMVFSVLLLSFGMIVRICRLFPLPLRKLDNLRRKGSKVGQDWLQKIYDSSRSDSLSAFLLEICVYKPLLAIFISCRLSLDTLTSKAFEVRICFDVLRCNLQTDNGDRCGG